MKERGIIFSAPMVRALLDGQKTMTRRIVKPKQAERLGVGLVGISARLAPDAPAAPIVIPEGVCPHGQPGDRLWVRETWQRDVPGCPGGLSYRADHRDPLGDGPAHPMKWRSPLFMPRTASRITLEIDAVRVERLHDITEEDAMAEGCRGTRAALDFSCRAEFETLWCDIYGSGSWAENPWLWVISFRRVDR